MKHRTLGATGLEISCVGFGAWAIGGGDRQFGWGPQKDRDSVDAIVKAIDLGINWIDTAAVYGFGHSEQIVGLALKNLQDSKRPYIFTKCGLVRNGGREAFHCLHRQSILKELEGSLQNLGTDYIDLYQIHWPAMPPENAKKEDIQEGWRTLVELKELGKVKHIGVSNFSLEHLGWASEIFQPETIQPPYSMIMRDVETEILPYCEKHNIGVISYSPMQSGLLTGKMTRERINQLPENDWRKSSIHFCEPNLTKNLKLVETLKVLARKKSTFPGAIAIAWALRQSHVSGVIVGARNPTQIAQTIEAEKVNLTVEDMALIKSVLPSSTGLF